MEGNKYKLLMRISLADLEIVKGNLHFEPYLLTKSEFWAALKKLRHIVKAGVITYGYRYKDVSKFKQEMF